MNLSEQYLRQLQVGSLGERPESAVAALLPSSTLPQTGVFLADAPVASSPPAPTAAETNPLGLIELILKDQPRLHWLLRHPTTQAAFLPKLLAISLCGFVLYGLAMSLVLNVTHCWPVLTPISRWLDHPRDSLFTFAPLDAKWGVLAPWIDGDALRLTAAYAFGLVAATGVCLPSLYFYCLLAGLRLRMVEIVVHAVKAKAVAAVALVGILPIYIAIGLGAVTFGVGPAFANLTMCLGLVLPFIAGIWGTASIYAGFSQMSDKLSAQRCQESKSDRECFLRRLVVSWSGCYLAVMPVMIYAVWEGLSRF